MLGEKSLLLDLCLYMNEQKFQLIIYNGDSHHKIISLAVFPSPESPANLKFLSRIKLVQCDGLWHVMVMDGNK